MADWKWHLWRMQVSWNATVKTEKDVPLRPWPRGNLPVHAAYLLCIHVKRERRAQRSLTLCQSNSFDLVLPRVSLWHTHTVQIHNKVHSVLLLCHMELGKPQRRTSPRTEQHNSQRQWASRTMFSNQFTSASAARSSKAPLDFYLSAGARQREQTSTAVITISILQPLLYEGCMPHFTQHTHYIYSMYG